MTTFIGYKGYKVTRINFNFALNCRTTKNSVRASFDQANLFIKKSKKIITFT